MLIRNARILTEKDGLAAGDLRVRNGRIDMIGGPIPPEQDEQICEAGGRVLVPGWIDIHNHGYCGTEFASSDEKFDDGLRKLAGRGVTSVAPTMRSLPRERLLAAVANARREAERRPEGAKLAGIHLEGPFLSPKRCGSMISDNLSVPDRGFLKELLSEGKGLIRVVALAPELPGAENLIDELRSSSVRPSIGHTDATYEEAKKAADAGAVQVTHLYNAMRPFSHREPGTVGEALTDDRLDCELICDFVHNSPAAVEIAFRAKGADRLIMISDTGVMAGRGDGDYFIEGVRRIVRGNTCKTENGTIAGSVCDIGIGFRNLMKAGYDLRDVSRMASRNPAKALGISDETGTIEEGKAADLILLSNDWTPDRVWIDGTEYPPFRI